jgi:indole-3-glycerol phosphate synthase
VIRDPFEPGAMADRYEEAGAQAVSVLIDDKYFGGGIRDLAEVRDRCRVPLLYKEFVVDEWQVWQAASLGAAAVLLIVSALDDETLRDLLDVCRNARVEALVEVHDESELERAVNAGAPCIGVNNRDLKTFDVSLDTSVRLAAQAPPDCTLVSESGIRSAADVARVRDAGYHAVLVGEHLLRQEDLGRAVQNLMGDVWASS